MYLGCYTKVAPQLHSIFKLDKAAVQLQWIQWLNNVEYMYISRHKLQVEVNKARLGFFGKGFEVTFSWELTGEFALVL